MKKRQPKAEVDDDDKNEKSSREDIWTFYKIIAREWLHRTLINSLYIFVICVSK